MADLLKLVGTATETQETEPRLEKRGETRRRARGQAVGTFIDPDGRLWLTRVSVVDESDGGLGVRCPVPVETGATFSLAMPGATSRIEGVVVHSRGRGGAYRLGLRRERRMAA